LPLVPPPCGEGPPEGRGGGQLGCRYHPRPARYARHLPRKGEGSDWGGRNSYGSSSPSLPPAGPESI
jgi:hypothetical protein